MNMKKALLLIFFLFALTLCQVYAQKKDTTYINDLIDKVHEITLVNPDYAMSLLDESYALSDELKYTKGLAKSLNLKGVVYFNWGLHDFALRSFTESLQFFQEINDSIGISIVYNNLGVLSYNIEKYPEALYFFNQSLYIQQKIENWINIIDIYNNIGSIYERLKQYDKAIKIHRKSIALSNKHNYPLGYSSALNNIGVVYENTGQTDSAIFYYKSAIENGYDFPGIQLALIHSNLARTYLNTGRMDLCKTELDTAKYYAEKIQSNTHLASIYELYAEYYEKQGNIKNAYSYLKKYKDIKVTLDEQNTTGEFADFLFSVQKKQWDKDKEQMNAQIRLQKKYQIVLIILIGISLLVFFLLFVSIKNRNALLKNRNKIAEIEALRVKEEMENKERIAKLEKEKLEVELKHKERQLTSLSLHLATKNEILQEINKNMGQLIKVQNKLKSNKIVQKIRSIIKMNLNDESIWNSFFFHFEQVYPRFFKILRNKHPNLTSGDEKLCAYIVTNLNNKEIAHILGISETSIKVKKNRLAKKLAIDNAAELNIYLKSFVQEQN